jgi:hypothetical protein
VRSDRRVLAVTTLISALAIMSGWRSNAQSLPSGTFTITISLIATTIHAGEIPVVEEITDNKTTHPVYAGWCEGGPLLDLITDKGEDISLHIIGNKRTEDTDCMLRPPEMKLESGYHNRGLWHIRTEQGYLVPGVYKLRIHRLDFREGDIKSGTEVYSNTVTLTVVP